jgi:hypothetical protein
MDVRRHRAKTEGLCLLCAHLRCRAPGAAPIAESQRDEAFDYRRKTDPKEDKVLEYSFRLGVNFRDRPGNFDSSGECGHAPTVRNPDTDPPLTTGIDFECDVDCDLGGVTVNLANNDGAVIVKLPERIRIWKGKDPDEAAMTALMAGADDKIFRLDRADPSECAALAYDRKELAALRNK